LVRKIIDDYVIIVDPATGQEAKVHDLRVAYFPRVRPELEGEM
jgi:hypothetical protein